MSKEGVQPPIQHTGSVRTEPIPISTVIEAASKEGIPRSQGNPSGARDIHLVLLGYCLSVAGKNHILPQVLRPLGIEETEALLSSLEGDGKGLKRWLGDRKIDIDTVAIDDILAEVNRHTAVRQLSEYCTKAWAGVRLGSGIEEILGDLRKAVSSAESNLDILKKGSSHAKSADDNSGRDSWTPTRGNGRGTEEPEKKDTTSA